MKSANPHSLCYHMACWSHTTYHWRRWLQV